MFRRIAFSLLILFPNAVWALEDTIQAGPGVEVQTNHRVGNQADRYTDNEIVHPVPVGFVKLGPLMINDKGVQLSVIQTWPFSLYLVGNFHGEKYRGQGMDERNESVFVGGGVRLYPLSVYTLSDIEKESRGRIFRAQLQFPWKLGSWLIMPTLGYTDYDQNYGRYYYGVAVDEVTSERSEYLPDGGSDQFYNLRIFYNFTKKWQLYLMYEIKEFDAEVTASPTVNDEPQHTRVVGLTYKIY